MKDGIERRNSASGGAFYSLASNFINSGGYISGCIYDENFNSKHIVTNKIEILNKMRDSKYVQSDIRGSFNVIKELIENNNKVLFCGTSCQVGAVKSFFKDSKWQEQLFTVSIICHGNPSPKV